MSLEPLGLGEPIDSRLPFVRKIHALDEARAMRDGAARAERLRLQGALVGEALRSGPKVRAVRTLPITTLAYPTAYALQGAMKLAPPFVILTHRALLVQLEVEGGIKNLLFNPSDPIAARTTPFFARLIARLGERLAEKLQRRFPPIEAQLRDLGLSPESIDLIAFDHFHTQDLRPLLGTSEPRPDGRAIHPRFPNALLLAPRAEWEDWDDLHPFEAAWFIRDGKRGIDESKVILTDHDLSLGPGAILLKTPGHTSGNQTLFVNTERGVFGCSENGTSADSWSPYESRIPGLRRHLRDHDVEVILNSNTPVFGREQMSSMLLERSVVDRVPDQPAFVQMFPSSELTPSPLAPGIRPSVIFGEIRSGEITPDGATPSGP